MLCALNSFMMSRNCSSKAQHGSEECATRRLLLLLQEWFGTQFLAYLVVNVWLLVKLHLNLVKVS